MCLSVCLCVCPQQNSVRVFSATTHCRCLKFYDTLCSGMPYSCSFFVPIRRQLFVKWWLFIFTQNFVKFVSTTFNFGCLKFWCPLSLIKPCGWNHFFTKLVSTLFLKLICIICKQGIIFIIYICRKTHYVYSVCCSINLYNKITTINLYNKITIMNCNKKCLK